MKLSTIIFALSLVVLIPTSSHATHLYGKSLLEKEFYALMQEFQFADSEGVSVRCHTTDEGSEDTSANDKLTLDILQNIINTVGLVFDDPQVKNTYLYAPQRGGKIYMNDEYGHVIQNMFGDYKYNLSTVSEMWMSNSPCANTCAFLLTNIFLFEEPKPTIYVGHLYRRKAGEPARQRALHCLAFMIKNGFKLKTWEWSIFQAKLTEKQCIDAVDTAMDNVRFLTGAGETVINLEEAHRLAKDKNVNDLKVVCKTDVE